MDVSFNTSLQPAVKAAMVANRPISSSHFSSPDNDLHR